MKRMNIIVAGNSFAGFTAAIELKRLVGYDHEIIVIGRSPDFVFIPSLMWYPFGLRKEEDIVFDVRGPFSHMDIKFLEAEIVKFDPVNKKVWLHDEYLPYDYLLVATGFRPGYEEIPGSGPEQFSHCISDLRCAREARRAWREFLNCGGPVVIGAADKCANYGAAYEFLFNVMHQLSKNSILHKTKLTFVTSEPYLGHLGIGEDGKKKETAVNLFSKYNVEWLANTSVSEVIPDKVILSDGSEIESRYTMIVPSVTGADAVKNSPGLGNEFGFIETNEEYRHHDFPEVYAAGMSVNIDAEVAIGECGSVARTSYPTELMAKTAAWNIFADIYGQEKKSLPFDDVIRYSVLDAENQGMMLIGEHMFSPVGFEMIIPGPQTHWAKLAHERYFMLSRSMGII